MINHSLLLFFFVFGNIQAPVQFRTSSFCKKHSDYLTLFWLDSFFPILLCMLSRSDLIMISDIVPDFSQYDTYLNLFERLVHDALWIHSVPFKPICHLGGWWKFSGSQGQCYFLWLWSFLIPSQTKNHQLPSVLIQDNFFEAYDGSVVFHLRPTSLWGGSVTWGMILRMDTEFQRRPHEGIGKDTLPEANVAPENWPVGRLPSFW